MLRGRNEDVLSLDIEVDVESISAVKPVEQMIAQHYGIALQGGAADTFLLDVARFAWRTKLSLHLTLDLMNDLRERAEAEAIHLPSHPTAMHRPPAPIPL